MTVLELNQHPHVDLADLLPRIEAGEPLEIHRAGVVVARIEPAHTKLAAWVNELRAMHESFTSPVYPGNSVVDMRQESR